MNFKPGGFMAGKRARQENSAAYSAPAVDMALNIIEFLSENSVSFGINELSRRLGIAVNSVYRVLMRLSERGYVEIDPAGNGYRLSTKFISLGMRLHNRIDLRMRARRHLERLTIDTGETCQIQTLQGNRMLVLDSVAPGTDFYLRVTPGSLVYCHANAYGKAVLAFLPEEQVRTVLSDGMPQLTDNSITKPDAFDRELEKARRTGITFDREEYAKGIYCVGAPVFDVQGNIAAGLGVTGLASRLSHDVEQKFCSLVLRCSAAVSADIGYTGDKFGEWISLQTKSQRQARPK